MAPGLVAELACQTITVLHYPSTIETFIFPAQSYCRKMRCESPFWGVRLGRLLAHSRAQVSWLNWAPVNRNHDDFSSTLATEV
jgi:hypothetical protein